MIMNPDQPNTFANKCSKCGHTQFRHMKMNLSERRNLNLSTAEAKLGKCKDCNCDQYDS